MSKLYHEKKFPIIVAETRSWPDDFVEIAELANESVEDIFFHTNSFESPWHESDAPFLRMVAEGPVRSTSVGDVVLLSNGDLYLYKMLGTEKVGTVLGPLPIRFQSGMLS